MLRGKMIASSALLIGASFLNTASAAERCYNNEPAGYAYQTGYAPAPAPAYYNGGYGNGYVAPAPAYSYGPRYGYGYGDDRYRRTHYGRAAAATVGGAAAGAVVGAMAGGGRGAAVGAGIGAIGGLLIEQATKHHHDRY